MKPMKRALVLLLSAVLMLTVCVPATLATRGLESTEPAAETTAPDTGAETTVTEPTETAEPETESTEATTPETESTEATTPETEATEPVPADTTGETVQETVAEENRIVTDEFYTISFDLGGGILLAREEDCSVTASLGEKITLPEAPEKEDRTFAGWKSAKTGEVYEAEGTYEVTDDDTLTAQWDMPQVLEVSATPQNGSALNEAGCVVEAVSEGEQAGVVSAVDKALGSDTVGALNVLAADISFLDDSDQELQPGEDESVPVKLTVPEDRIDDNAEFLVVYHMVEQEDSSYFAEPVQYVPRGDGNQEISFGATGFSIYAVAAVGKKDDDKQSVLIKGDDAYEMVEGEDKVFFFQDENASQYTYHRYTWSIKGNDDTVRAYSTSIYFQNKDSASDNKNNFQYPWLSLDALRPGKVTLVVTYYCYNGSSWWKPTGTAASGTVEITLLVTAKENGLAIENHIPENGTLTPVWRGTEAKTVADHYVWTKEFYHTYNDNNEVGTGHKGKSTIDEDALMKDESGSINVAIDAGGIAQEQDDQGRDMLCFKLYTCTAYDKEGKELGSATYRVEYGEDVLNGSFEYPKIPAGTGYAFANGTRQLFWKSTAPGSGGTLGMDVELGNDSANNPYLTPGSKANDGDQFAELNAEKAGSLYQDVLTAPGATLSWSFAHRSRKGTGTNVMYLVIAASKDAQKITNQSEINALTAKYQLDGDTVEYNGGTYTLWKFEGNPDYWQDHSGSYTVPDNQYATRFFFVSATGTTTGNLIDGIHFNEIQRYVVEYYLNDELQNSLTEISNAELDTVVTPKNTGADALKNAFLTSSTINGENYGGVTLSIKARKTTDVEYEGCRNVLRLYYTTGTVSVKKVVEIEGWDDLTDEEKAAVGGPNGYTASFKLYDDTENGAKLVATASVTIDLDEFAHKTAVAVFKDVKDENKNFAPAPNHSYRVVEDTKEAGEADTAPHVYRQTVAYAPSAAGNDSGLIRTDKHGTGSCTVTNTYSLVVTTLTIQKKGWNPIDENQTFVFRVQGMDGYTKEKVDLTVTVHGNDQTTICNLPTGNYMVTEITSWSWRYIPDKSVQTVTLNSEETVTFNNTRVTDGDSGCWKWLNGDSWADNRWPDGKKLGPEEEGGEQNG